MSRNSRTNSLSIPTLCALVYFCSYITRLNYSTVMVEIMVSENFSLTEVSFPVTALFITYGIGQLVCGYIGDKMKPYKEVYWGLLISSVMCCLVPVIHSPILIAAAWAVNGFAQAMIWPPIVKIIAYSVSKNDYGKAVTTVCAGSSLATISMCLLGPAVIKVSSWRFLFFITAGISFAVNIFWKKTMSAPSNDMKFGKTEKNDGNQNMSGFCYVLSAIIIVSIVLDGILRDGITTWLPIMLVDNFHLGRQSSILISVVLPLFSFVVFSLVTFITNHLISNEVLCAAIGFSICSILLFILFYLGESGIVVTTLILTLSNGLAHGINFLLISLVPRRLFHYGHAAFLSGVFNAGTYVGSAISAYGIAVFTDANGWKATYLLWGIIAVAGAIICVFSTKPWKCEMVRA